MITIPVEAASYLPYVMEAAEREGYLGLMVVLARTAEARSLHEELTRDWTSIHDVTGHALAVLCPEPEREELRSRVSSLTAVRRAGEEPPRRMRGLAELAAVRKQTAGLQQHLDMVAHVDPDLGRELADGLSAHIESDAPADEAGAWLSGLAARVVAHPRRAELLGLDTKLPRWPDPWRRAPVPEGEGCGKPVRRKSVAWSRTA
ncbi:MAG TPA: hypothetical protein VFH94_02590 [Streptomyces sp.]|nr:hypothetical protein [Streptomyces sp.]